jgi:hypothetical protein
MSLLKNKATKVIAKLVRKHGQEVAATIAMSLVTAAAGQLAEKAVERRARKDRDEAKRKKKETKKGKKGGKSRKRAAKEAAPAATA